MTEHNYDRSDLGLFAATMLILGTIFGGAALAVFVVRLAREMVGSIGIEAAVSVFRPARAARVVGSASCFGAPSTTRK